MQKRKMTFCKKELRRRLLELRDGLSSGQRQELSAKAATLIRSLDVWRRAQTVLLYAPFRNELDVSSLLEELFGRGATVLLPRCRPGRNGEMDLARSTCAADLVPGAYGILEPNPETCPALPEPGRNPAVDLAVVPGVGFDRRGYRIGFGQGYYDRLLGSEAMAGCLSVGVGYHFQLVDNIPCDPWDVPLRAVVTDKEVAWTAS
jgi:5-formyltetrahydrofolate cyclo-ligase